MTRKTAAMPSTPEAPLLAEAADLSAQIESSQETLRAALLAGAGTVAIRAELTRLQGRADAVSWELLRVADERLDQVNAEIEAAAHAMGDGLEVRLAALLASLQPPPAPL